MLTGLGLFHVLLVISQYSVFLKMCTIRFFNHVSEVMIITFFVKFCISY